MLNKKLIIDLGSPKVRKNILIYGAAFIVLVIAVAYFCLSGVTAEETPIENEIAATDEFAEEKSEPVSIFVDVSGAVKSPSVIELEEGSRIIDAIEAAGGLKEDANLTGINRAEILADGAYLYVPTNKEIAENIVAADPSTAGNTGGSGTGSSGSSGLSGSSQGKININTADSATLQQLNGVGPATAEKIIEYRTSSGRFSKIEDLKKVSGIGDKTFEKLAPYIKV